MLPPIVRMRKTAEGFRANERKYGARNDGHVGVASEFEHAQGVLDIFVTPRVAGDHGEPEHADIG